MIRILLKHFVYVVMVWFVTAFVWFVLWLLIIIPYQHEHGLDLSGAKNKWYQAMQSGDGKAAIFWGKQIEVLSNTTLRGGIYQNLGAAYALDGRHEVAEHYYALAKLLQDERIPPP